MIDYDPNEDTKNFKEDLLPNKVSLFLQGLYTRCFQLKTGQLL